MVVTLSFSIIWLSKRDCVKVIFTTITQWIYTQKEFICKEKMNLKNKK